VTAGGFGRRCQPRTVVANRVLRDPGWGWR
jgi:hypothetical protein